MKASVLPAGVTLTGEIEGRGDLVVAGVVEGPIALEGELTIEEGGEVRGDVSVSSLVVRGLLVGMASAKESVRIEPSATVVGDARAPRVNIVEGARFRGRVQMTGDAPVAPAPRRRRTRTREADDRAARPELRAMPPAPVELPREMREERPRHAGPREQPRGERRPEERRHEERRREDPRRDDPRREDQRRPERRRDEPRRVEARREPSREPAQAPRAAPVPKVAAAVPDERESERKPGRSRPPPPRIPAVQRQKARRKDTAPAPDGL